MLQLVYYVFFILYNFSIFIYSEKLFATRTKKKSSTILYITIFNLILNFLALKSNVIFPEYTIMITYFIALYIQFLIVYKGRKMKTLYVAISFAINYFSIKFIIFALWSLGNDMSIAHIMNTPSILIMISILTNIANIIYFLLFHVYFPDYNLNIILSDKSNIKISISVLALIFIFLMFNTYLFYVHFYVSLLPIFIIKTSLYSFIGFWITLLYSFFYSKLQLYSSRAENIQKELEQEESELKKLETEANFDYFTSCFKRDFVYEKIDKLIEDKYYFSLVFIDIDGLKTTNDVYGHDEGDFYIKEVSNILNDEFVGKIIGRIGGDEFIIVLEAIDIYATLKCTLRCFDRALAIQKEFDKPYATSISYGIVEVLPNNTLSRDDIIKMADQNMYDFKKKRKKHRKN